MCDPLEEGLQGGRSSSAPAQRVPHQHQSGVPERDSMVPNGVRAQGPVKLLHCLLLWCRCQDLPPALPPSPSPCSRLCCHRQFYYFWLFRLIIGGCVAAIASADVITHQRGTRCDEEGSPTVPSTPPTPAHGERGQQRSLSRGCRTPACCGRSLNPVSLTLWHQEASVP